MSGDRSFRARWDFGLLDSIDRYYSNTPGFINVNRAFFVVSNKESVDFGKMVGIDSGEKDFIEIAMMFKFDVQDSASTPRLQTIASVMGKERDTARRIKKRLIEIGALTVEFDEKRNKPDEYIFKGLAEQCWWWHEFWIKYQPDLYKRCRVDELKEWLLGDGKTIFEKEKHSLLKIEAPDISVPMGADPSVPHPLIDQRQINRIKEIEFKEEKPSLGGGNNKMPTPIKAGSPSNNIVLPPKENSAKQQVLIDWVSEILKTTDKNISIENWSWAQIFKTYKREVAVAKQFQELTETFAGNANVEIDKIPSPSLIFNAFWGETRNGWLFQKSGKGFSKDLSFSPDGMLKHYPTFLASSTSVFNLKDKNEPILVTTLVDETVDMDVYNKIMEKLRKE